jgi:NADH:ubiquinone oxidoreductase subunit F (NADH-binding)
MHGLFATSTEDNPTVENNAETLANVAHILAHGPDWLRANGTSMCPGTMLFTVCGDVAREGVFELPFGTPLRHLVEDVAGATGVKLILPGASSTVITPDMLDMPMEFGAFRAAGTGLGAGGFAVYDESACAVSVTRMFSRFLYVESCGQCPSCKRGGGAIADILDRLETGDADAGELEELTHWAGEVTDGQKCALPTGQERLTLSMISLYAREFAEHVGYGCVSGRRLVLPKIKDYDEQAGRFVYDQLYEYADPQWGEMSSIQTSRPSLIAQSR